MYSSNKNNRSVEYREGCNKNVAKSAKVVIKILIFINDEKIITRQQFTTKKGKQRTNKTSFDR